MAFKLIEPPPLQPQMPILFRSMYGRCAQDFADGRRLILRGQDADLVVDRLAPGPAARGGRASIVKAHDDVISLGEHHVPEVVAAPPSIKYGLAGRLSIHMHQERILPFRIEFRR